MRGNEFLDKMELIDSSYIESAEASQKRFNTRKFLVLAACMCLLIGTAIVIHLLKSNPMEPITTAKVTYIDNLDVNISMETELVLLTEEEMFWRDSISVFRGRVIDLNNVLIDFSGGLLNYRCVATIEVYKVYKGEITVGDEIKILLPCPIDVNGLWVEDTEVISNLRVGMEGIFMPRMYDESSYLEENNSILNLKDLADCGFGDGTRWAFLSNGEKLIFSRVAYTGAKNAKSLDDIEAYIIKMLEKYSK